MDIKEFIKEDTKPEKIILTDDTNTEKKQEEKPPEVELPVLDAPTFFYRKDTKMFWLGIPVMKVDAVTASFIMDSMKLHYLDIIKSIAAEIQQKKNSIIPASTFTKMRENFVKKFKQ